jgi:trk system potassium uptake protein TrkH
VNVLRDVQLLGWVLVALAVAQLVPAGCAVWWGEPSLPYLASAIAAGVTGLPVALASQPTRQQIRVRDGFVIASGTWLLAASFGALPYIATGALDPVDALFEAVSGFTTTAASVIPSVESLPRALIVWRAMTQWLGGMGVLVVAVALLPFLGIGGMQLFSSGEARASSAPGRPRFAATAGRLFRVYLGLTALAFAALTLAGLDSYDAFCHALTTVSTGGFSTRDGSVGSFGSAAVEWVVVLMMFLGATSFVIHDRILSGRIRGLLRDGEFRYYAGTLIIASGLLVWVLAGKNLEPGNVREAVFQAVSMMSGTGYHTADFESWGGFAQLLLLALMVLGGMSGSTTGGIKSLRLLLGLRALRDSFTPLLHPHAVRRVKYAGRIVSDEVISAIWAFFTAYFLIVAAAAALMATAGYDVVTSVSTGLSLTANVGPALGDVGPDKGFAHLPSYVKLGLSACMVAGRLDVFTLLVVLQPRFWRN